MDVVWGRGIFDLPIVYAQLSAHRGGMGVVGTLTGNLEVGVDPEREKINLYKLNYIKEYISFFFDLLTFRQCSSWNPSSRNTSLIFIMEIPIPGETVFILKQGPEANNFVLC